MYRVDVGLEVIFPSKLLITLIALVGLEFFVNLLDVSLEVCGLFKFLLTHTSFDMPFHVLFLAELFVTDLALERF